MMATGIVVVVVLNAATPSPLTIIGSMDPAFANETVLSTIPGMESAGWDPSDVHVRLCAPGADAADCRADGVRPLRARNGSVHWVVPADTPDAEYEYTVCGGARAGNGINGTNVTNGSTTCSPRAPLNRAQVWWHQCAYAWGAGAPSSAHSVHNGLRCTAGASVLRVFGNAIAFGAVATAPSHVRLTPTEETSHAIATANVTVLQAQTQSVYDATFELPATLAPGAYRLEARHGLPNSTWAAPRDLDQQILLIHRAAAAQAAAAQQPTSAVVSTREELYSALAAVRSAGRGAVVLAPGVNIQMRDGDRLKIPNGTSLTGGGGGGTGSASGPSTLVWPDLRRTCADGSAVSGSPIIGPDTVGAGTSILLADLRIIVAGGLLKGCPAVIGTQPHLTATDITLRRLNVTMLDTSAANASVFGSLLAFRDASHLLVEDSTFLHGGRCVAGDSHAGVSTPILSLAGATHDVVVRRSIFMVGLSGWHADTSWHVVFESNTFTGYFDDDPARPLPYFAGSFWFSSYSQGQFPGAGRFFYANTTQRDRAERDPVGGGESFTLDGGNSGGYMGPVAAVGSSLADVSFSTVSDVCWKPTSFNPLQCSTDVRSWPGGRTGHAALVLAGPGQGQWRRVVGVGGENNRGVILDRPFDPPIIPHESIVQIGPFRGQLLLVRNHFISGGTVQLYAACYDCVVAENEFKDFGFSNWGRNPHAQGWQPNLNNLIVDNVASTRGFEVLGCSATCSDAKGGSCASVRDAASTCAGNATSLPGRDCSPLAAQRYAGGVVGWYGGAINRQLAWRRNALTELLFNKPTAPWLQPALLAVPLVDGAIVEHTHWRNGSALRNANSSTNVLLRDF